MKRIIALILAIATVTSVSQSRVSAASNNSQAIALETSVSGDVELNLSAASVCLMEASTGRVLYSENEENAASVASVTKVMSLLLVCEALESGKYSLGDTVTVSSYAASMGGSQVFLEEGERITVEELLKCTVIASANDAIVALAELTAGSESAFVRKMNDRARELGLRNTAFENATGLDDTTVEHYSCAMDVAVMSRELVKHDIILKYSSIWQDSIRNGEFTLTNTNRLVRYYDGCNGLKTGSTDKAGYCVSATAKRGGMQLIAVVLGAETRDARNADARTLLDYGFASYALFEHSGQFLEYVPVLGGTSDNLAVYSGDFREVIEREKLSGVEMIYEIPDTLTAPVEAGQRVGRIIFKLDGLQIGECDIYCQEGAARIGVFELFGRILRRMICGS